MSTYTKYKVYLTPNQKEKVKSAFKSNKSSTLRIQPKVGNTEIMLTSSQINHILKTRRENKGVHVHLSKTQLEKSGGFISLLAGLAPVALKGITSGAAGFLGSKVLQKNFGKKGSGIKTTKKAKKSPTKKLTGFGGIFSPGEPKIY